MFNEAREGGNGIEKTEWNPKFDVRRDVIEEISVPQWVAGAQARHANGRNRERTPTWA